MKLLNLTQGPVAGQSQNIRLKLFLRWYKLFKKLTFVQKGLGSQISDLSLGQECFLYTDLTKRKNIYILINWAINSCWLNDQLKKRGLSLASDYTSHLSKINYSLGLTRTLLHCKYHLYRLGFTEVITNEAS